MSVCVVMYDRDDEEGRADETQQTDNMANMHLVCFSFFPFIRSPAVSSPLLLRLNAPGLIFELLFTAGGWWMVDAPMGKINAKHPCTKRA